MALAILVVLILAEAVKSSEESIRKTWPWRIRRAREDFIFVVMFIAMSISSLLSLAVFKRVLWLKTMLRKQPDKAPSVSVTRTLINKLLVSLRHIGVYV